MYLFSKLHQDVIELLHHLWVDSFPWSNVSEIQKHIKGSLSRPQCLKWVINEVSSFIFNGCNFSVEPVHDISPTCSMSKAEGIKSNLKNINNLLTLSNF